MINSLFGSAMQILSLPFFGNSQGTNSLQAAQMRNELVLFYQPKVNMASGLLVGVEALLRWQHPSLGLLTPAMFDKAINSGKPVVIDLGRWAIEEAIKQISRWGKQGLSMPISVNVMASELTKEDFCTWLDGMFKDYPDVSPAFLELEIVESSQLSNPLLHLIEVINNCRAIGIKVALDDFGTGYSSLSYVRNLPADHVKIDQTFVRDIAVNDKDRQMVRVVISLATSFGCTVIAEGVEKVEDGLILMKLGCVLAQGYAISHPMKASDVPAWANSYKGHQEWIEHCASTPFCE